MTNHQMVALIAQLKSGGFVTINKNLLFVKKFARITEQLVLKLVMTVTLNQKTGAMSFVV